MEKKLFGTNGVRGIIGTDLTPDLVVSIGEAFGTMRRGCIGVGRDTRTSGETLKKAAIAGLLATGCDVVDCGVLPTPALQYLVRERFDGGIMITASHNPPEYNGVKIIESDGTEMGDEETIKLEQILFSRSFSLAPWDRVGTETSAPDAIAAYSDAIVRQFPAGIGKGMTVVVDPGSGPACLTTPRILMAMGCKVITINGSMDGTFPGRMPEPSVDGLRPLADLVVSSGAAFGIAHDGDADRAVFIDEQGRFIEENQEFALFTGYICEQGPGLVVTPVSTGQIVEQVANAKKSEVVYTPVGSIYVARSMRTLLERGKNVVFGGEGNGGLIFPNHQFCRDGGMTAATMVSVVAQSGAPLSELVKKLPERHVVKDKISTSHGARVLESLTNFYQREKADTTDGLKLFRQDSWALIRASGTEPIVRIIVDAPTKEEAKRLFEEVRARFEQTIIEIQ
jgi:phosphomannomutase/phosphoglucomutase